MSDKTSNASGPWSDDATWSPSGVPAANQSVDVAAGNAVTLSADVAQSGAVEIHGVVNANGQAFTASGPVEIAGGGQLLAGDPTNTAPTTGSAGSLGLSGAVDLYGTLGAERGQWPSTGYAVLFTAGSALTLHDGATLWNFSVDDFEAAEAFYGFQTGLASWQFSAPGDTVTYRQYFDSAPQACSEIRENPWPAVSLGGNLGGIELLTRDYAGAVHQPLYPPTAYVYRNGQLWNGAIRVTNGSALRRYKRGQFFFDLDFNDGVWQPGDRGQIKMFYAQHDAAGNIAWYGRVYYWLVNKLAYETWQVVTTALASASAAAAAAASNTAGLQTWMTAALGYLTSISTSLTMALGTIIAAAGTSYPDSLLAARDQCVALLTQITASPKLSYSAYGRKYSWTEYQAMLTKQIEDLNRLIAQANPYEIVSRG